MLEMKVKVELEDEVARVIEAYLHIDISKFITELVKRFLKAMYEDIIYIKVKRTFRGDLYDRAEEIGTEIFNKAIEYAKEMKKK